MLTTQVLSIGDSHKKRKFRISYGRYKPGNEYFISVYEGNDDVLLIEKSTFNTPLSEIISLYLILGVPLEISVKASLGEDI